MKMLLRYMSPYRWKTMLSFGIRTIGILSELALPYVLSHILKNVIEYKKENPNTSILIITHLPKLLEYLKPDYVHVVINGNICETGGYELAKKIEENGYNEYLDKSNIIDRK